MNDDPATADHLTDLDARFEGHLGALRRRAEQFRAALAERAASLGEPAPPGAAAGVPWDDLSDLK
ncbi:MAG: hypothetical protein QOI11_2683 [Candidatus Eremiobacteraeota bacterium]|nr:hypothetical protein [Candidatus Eremiobacteraeota bacterium]